MSAANPSVETFGAPFRVGAALSRAFQVFGAGFGKFVALSALALLPVLAVNLIVATRMTAISGPITPDRTAALISAQNVLALTSVSGVLALVLGSLANAMCLYGAYRIMRGQDFALGQSLAAGLRRLGPVIGVALLSGLFVVLGFLALVVPGIMLVCAFYVAVPACVIERIGPFASLKRSRQLTKGSRWGVFGLALLVAIGAGIVGSGLSAVGGLIGGLVLKTIVSFVVQAVMQGLGAVIAAVVYHDLRVAKEGVDIDDLVSVFD